jgi:hypothetical protein
MEKIMDKVTGTWTVGKPWGNRGSVEVERQDGPGHSTLVAIVSDRKDADVVAACYDLLAACEDLIGLAVTGAKELAKGINGGVSEETDDADGLPAGWEIRTRIEQARAAIAKAKGTP